MIWRRNAPIATPTKNRSCQPKGVEQQPGPGRWFGTSAFSGSAKNQTSTENRQRQHRPAQQDGTVTGAVAISRT